MKILVISSVIALAASCGSTKETTENVKDVEHEQKLEQVESTENTNNTEDVSNERTANENTDSKRPANEGIAGTVRLTDSGCMVYIEVKMDNDRMVTMYPVNLDEEFKIDYAAILFDYNLSRAPQPEGCDADMTVSVSNVKRIRK